MGCISGLPLLSAGSHVSAMAFLKPSDPTEDPIRAAYREALKDLGSGHAPGVYVQHMRIPWKHLPWCRAIAQNLIKRHGLPLRLPPLKDPR